MEKNSDKYILDKGTYNSMPKPYTEISEEQFWHHVLIWGFGKDQDFRQILPDKEPELFEGLEPKDRYARDLHILYYHEYAIGVLEQVVNAIPKPWKFLKIGCQHTTLSKRIDTIRGWHERTCADCGLEWNWDSSD